MNRSTSMYQDMASRTGSSIYIGVVGPVRTGKSTFIKRFMETQVLPNIENDYRRERARDELPQSGSGRTIMTAEPKFVPEEAAEVRLPDGTSFSVRLIDCVGYMVPGAVGQFEDLAPRMVMTPWYDHEIPMTEAAELGTRKVICDHSTVGIVVTTDGSVTDIPRSDYLEAEERVIRELQELGKPFVVLVNSLHPEEARPLAEELQQKYGVRCLAVNCLELGEGDLQEILRSLLYEFPVQELQLFFPEWVEALPPEHPIPAGLYHAVGQEARRLEHVRQLEGCMAALEQSEQIRSVMLRQMDLGTGVGQVEVQLPRSLFYDTVNQQTGLSITDDGDLMEQLVTLAGLRKEYAMALPLFVMVSLFAENQQIVLALRGGGDLIAVVSGEAGDVVHGAGIVHQDLDLGGVLLGGLLDHDHRHGAELSTGVDHTLAASFREFSREMASNTTKPMTTATLPALAIPPTTTSPASLALSGLPASAKLWAKAAPTIIPNTVTALSPLPEPARIS